MSECHVCDKDAELHAETETRGASSGDEAEVLEDKELLKGKITAGKPREQSARVRGALDAWKRTVLMPGKGQFWWIDNASIGTRKGDPRKGDSDSRKVNFLEEASESELKTKLERAERDNSALRKELLELSQQKSELIQELEQEKKLKEQRRSVQLELSAFESRESRDQAVEANEKLAASNTYLKELLEHRSSQLEWYQQEINKMCELNNKLKRAEAERALWRKFEKVDQSDASRSSLTTRGPVRAAQ